VKAGQAHPCHGMGGAPDGMLLLGDCLGHCRVVLTGVILRVSASWWRTHGTRFPRSLATVWYIYFMGLQLAEAGGCGVCSRSAWVAPLGG
jgi:hypothetical protein